jgi:predicted PhzF superfamily epimerase YddE/YHI9
MNRLPYFHVDAFTSRLFAGNPAGVCPVPEWPADELMRRIAAENNLSETAFLVDRGEHYDLRWFTPAVEVDLCGHATLAGAHIVFTELKKKATEVRFETRSGPLVVKRSGELLVMDFPARPGQPVATPPPALLQGLGRPPLEVLKARDFLCVYASEQEVRDLKPDFAALARVDSLGVIATAPGTDADFVSRFFAPRAGLNEDPVTGSAHCTLVPYWSQRLKKKELLAHQVSARGGELFCTDRADRTLLAGHAITYSEGTLRLG